MTWRRVLKSVQALLAHGSLFCFTLLLVLKLDHFVSYSWWYCIFSLPFKFGFALGLDVLEVPLWFNPLWFFLFSLNLSLKFSEGEGLVRFSGR